VLRAVTTAVVLAALVLLPAPSVAHMVRFPRMVHVRVEAERIAVAVAVRRHDGPDAASLRSQFDKDSSGVLEPVEQDELAGWLDRRARKELRVELDGVVLEAEGAESDLQLDGGDTVRDGGGFTFRSAAYLALSLRSGAHRLVITDTPDNLRAVVPLRLDLPSGWEAGDSSATGDATPLVRADELTLQGAFAGEGGSIVLQLEVPPRGAGATVSE